MFLSLGLVELILRIWRRGDGEEQQEHAVHLDKDARTPTGSPRSHNAARIAVSPKPRRTLALAALAGTAAILVASAGAQVAGPPSGDGVQPVFVAGNPTCGDLDPNTAELRVEPVADGTYTDGTLIVTIDVRDTASGPVVDFTSNIGVDSVFVKGGPNGNFYNYQDTIGENKDDTNLHAPVNEENNEFFGLSHVSFCYDVTASVEVDKDGPDLSKVGDDVAYQFTIRNTGDVPLTLQSVSDTLLGDLAVTAGLNGCGTLAAGASCNFTVNRTVQPGDPDPLPNTVTVQYRGTLPSGVTTVTDTDNHSVNLFQPAVAVDKQCTDLSKVGDRVDCTVEIDNNSSSDSPDLVIDKISDTVQGDLTDSANYDTSDCGASLASSAGCTITYHYTVPQGASDPYQNTVTVETHPDGFTNDVDDTASDSVNLFQPAVAVDKQCTDLSKVGDRVDCTVEIDNNSSSDSPDLVIDKISDTVQGDLTDSANYDTSDCGASLASSAGCTITYHYTVPQGASDPYQNTVTVETHPDGFTNDVDDTASDSVNLFQPAVAVDKQCTDLSKVGDRVDCTVEIDNNSSSDSPDLVIDKISDTVQGDLTDSANYDTSDCGASLASSAGCTITYHYTVPQGASDPYQNTVTVETHPDGFTNDVDDTASDSVNLFQPAVAVDKQCTDLSKVGDRVDCTVEIDNNSSSDSPDLVIDKISDTVQGDLTDSANYDTSDCGASLASSAGCTITYHYTVPQGASDPYQNTVTVETHPDGFTNDVDDTASDSVNLFQPAVAVDKQCTDLSKVGDRVDCTVEIDNNSSSDSPDLVIDKISDTVQGDLTDSANYDTSDCGASLASSAGCTITYHYTVPQGASDPYQNTVTVETHPDGFTNDVDDTASDSVNLFQPAVAVDKQCTDLSKVGDRVDCTVEIDNNSSSDSPDLVIDKISDTVQGDLTDSANYDTSDCGASLASSAGCTITYHYTVPQGASDPYQNTVTVETHPDGFTNDVDDTASDSVNLFQPAVQVVKTGPAEATEGQTITYSYTITNTSSSDSPNLVLDSVIDNKVGNLTSTASANGCGNLAPSASCSFTANFTIPLGTPSPLVNVVTVQYHPTGFTNEVKDDDDHSVVVRPAAPPQGCTPGFWKNHPNAWPPTGYSRNQTLESVFDVPNAFGLDNNTLLQALSFDGGSGTVGAARILLRAAVAALLNAAHPNINYPRSPASVIADVNAALASNNRATILTLAGRLDYFNNRGCPINGK